MQGKDKMQMKTCMKTAIVLGGIGLASLALGATKPIAQWSFEDPSDLGKDSIGDNDLVAAVATESYGTPAQISSGKVGCACDLKRTKDVIGNAMYAKAGKLPTGNNPFTVSAWIRPDSVSSSTAYLLIHQSLTGGIPGKWEGSAWNGWYLRFASTTQLSLCFGGWQGGTTANGSNVIATVPDTAYKDGLWHLVTVSRDANNVAKVYLDGVLKASKTVTAAVGANSVLRIGSYEKINYFSGDYDEIKAWDEALSDEEILREYKAKSKIDETIVDGVAELSGVDRVSGTVSGEGTLTFGGINYTELLAPLAFGGVYRTYSAIVDLGYVGTAQALPASSRLDLACTGGFNVMGDTTVAGLSGDGVLSEVSIADGQTLTIADDDDATLAGGLKGKGSVAKSGSGTLTLMGGTSVANVAVDAGVLKAETLPFYSQGLVGYWRFEDGAAIGRNLTGHGDFTVMATDGATTAQIADGRLGRGVSLRRGTTIANALLAPAGAVPAGGSAFTVAAWIRPASDSPKTAYVLVNRTIGGGKPAAWTGAAWDGWNMRFVDGGTKLSVDFETAWREHKDDAQSLRGSIPATAYNDGQWHHVAVARAVQEEYADGKTTYRYFVTLYFDGAQIVTKELTVNQSVNKSTRLSVGGHDASNSFSGDYDEVVAFSRALSSDEIAALFAAAKPIAETRISDEATARWTFDELVTEGGQKLFKDTGAAGLGCDFLNTANGSGQLVECVTGEDINGGAAYVNHKDTFLQLADGSKAGANLVQYGWPTFTVSLRIKNVSLTGLGRNPVFCFGDAQGAEGCLRLSYEGTNSNPGTAPQIVRILAGNSHSNGTAGVVLDDTISSSGEKSPWTTYTFVNNQDVKKMNVYRDGVFVKEISTSGNLSSGSCFSFRLERLDIGYNTYGKYSGFMVDDLCVFRKRVLNDAEVKRLVREQAGVPTVPLTDAAVSVAKDAELHVGAGEYALASLAGTGAVTLDAYATLAVADWSQFAGTLSGTGAVRISKPLPDRKFAQAVIDATGAVAFDAEPDPGRYVVAKADAFAAPDGLLGWKVLVDGRELASDKYVFKVIGDEFVCKVKGGSAIVIR